MTRITFGKVAVIILNIILAVLGFWGFLYCRNNFVMEFATAFNVLKWLCLIVGILAVLALLINFVSTFLTWND